MADLPLRTATDHRLGKPLLHQLANRTSGNLFAPGPFRSPAFVLRHYAVLAHLSMSYPPQLDMSRCITHPSATRHQVPESTHAAVRLACVKHAASVQSEPGSNSFVLILHYSLFRPLHKSKPTPQSARRLSQFFPYLSMVGINFVFIRY